MTITAIRREGWPQTEEGRRMTLACWFELSEPLPVGDHTTEHVAVMGYGVYECDGQGRIQDWNHRVVRRVSGQSIEDALRTAGCEVRS